MSKPHNFVVPLVLYPFDIMFSVGETDKQLKASVEGYITEEYRDSFLDDDCLFKMSATCKGRTIHSVDGGQTVVRFKKAKPEPEIVTHEIFHAVEFIFEKIGLPHSRDTSEAYAYALQHVTKEFYYNLNHKQK